MGARNLTLRVTLSEAKGLLLKSERGDSSSLTLLGMTDGGK
jgi:hypothetical protein